MLSRQFLAMDNSMLLQRYLSMYTHYFQSWLTFVRSIPVCARWGVRNLGFN